MKILFLDMDGVVNKGRDNASPDRYRYNDKWSNPSDRFDLYYVDPELAARVSALVRDFDLHIVSTSTWRCGRSVDEFRELLNNRFLPGDRLISFTPDGESEGMTRADEIRYFLLHCEEDIERYVILDDDRKLEKIYGCDNLRNNTSSLKSKMGSIEFCKLGFAFEWI